MVMSGFVSIRSGKYIEKIRVSLLQSQFQSSQASGREDASIIRSIVFFSILRVFLCVAIAYHSRNVMTQCCADWIFRD